MKKFIEIVEYSTGEVMERRDVSDKEDRYIGKVMDGMSINMDEKYYTRMAVEDAAPHNQQQGE